MNPDLKQLEICVTELAKSMQLKPLPHKNALELINHVLYDTSYDDIGGKQAWVNFKSNLITKTEITNLLMAHAVTKVSSYNNVNEQSSNTHESKSLFQKFYSVLHGHDVEL